MPRKRRETRAKRGYHRPPPPGAFDESFPLDDNPLRQQSKGMRELDRAVTPGIHLQRSTLTPRPTPQPTWTPTRRPEPEATPTPQPTPTPEPTPTDESCLDCDAYQPPSWISQKSWAKVLDALRAGDIDENFVRKLSQPKKRTKLTLRDMKTKGVI